MESTIMKTNSELYLEEMTKQVNLLSRQKVEAICGSIYDTLKLGKTLYIAGNGGSAATANHFAADLSNELLINRMKKGTRVISLSESVTRITAIANDFGYNNIFSRQLEHCDIGDSLLLLSVSGESENLVNAAYTAKQCSARVMSITARDSTLTSLSEDFIVFGNGDYGMLEDFHSIFLHILKRRINSCRAHRYSEER